MPRKDFCLRLSYGDDVARIGEGMGIGGDRVRDARRDAAGCNPSVGRRAFIGRAEVVALLFNVSDIAVALATTERLPGRRRWRRRI